MWMLEREREREGCEKQYIFFGMFGVEWLMIPRMRSVIVVRYYFTFFVQRFVKL